MTFALTNALHDAEDPLELLAVTFSIWAKAPNGTGHSLHDEVLAPAARPYRRDDDEIRSHLGPRRQAEWDEFTARHRSRGSRAAASPPAVAAPADQGRALSVTSPAVSVISRPLTSTRQRAGLVDPGAEAFAVLPAHAPAEQRVALAQGRRAPNRGPDPSRFSSAASSAVSVGSTSAGDFPKDPATSAASSGSEATSTATLTPIPSTAHSRGLALGEDAGHLAPVQPDVVGPLDQRVGPGHVGDGQPGPQRQQVVELAQDQRRGDRHAGRRDPRAPLASAALGLLVGRDERPVRRALVGQLARPRVGRSDRLVMLAGLTQRHDSSSSSPADTPSSAAALPPLTATATSPAESS